MAKKEKENNSGIVVATAAIATAVGYTASLVADKIWGVNDKVKLPKKKDKKKDK